MFRFKLPKRDEVVKMWPLNYLQDHLSSPGLWSLRRRSVSLGAAWGLFCCCLPIPFQMVLATTGCIIWRIHLPVSLACVWVSNPITIPIFLYAGYLIGEALAPSNIEMSLADFESVGNIAELFANILPQLLLGSLVMGIVFATVGYLLTQAIWTYWMRQRWLNIAKIRELRNTIHSKISAHSSDDPPKRD